jgi:hypothetical protein
VHRIVLYCCFHVLTHLLPPYLPPYLRTGVLEMALARDFACAPDVMRDDIWRKVYAVATSDGYVHILSNQRHEVPDR